MAARPAFGAAVTRCSVTSTRATPPASVARPPKRRTLTTLRRRPWRRTVRRRCSRAFSRGEVIRTAGAIASVTVRVMPRAAVSAPLLSVTRRPTGTVPVAANVRRRIGVVVVTVWPPTVHVYAAIRPPASASDEADASKVTGVPWPTVSAEAANTPDGGGLTDCRAPADPPSTGSGRPSRPDPRAGTPGGGRAAPPAARAAAGGWA